MEDNLKNDISKLGFGSHICSIYRNKQEQLPAAVHFLANGLKQNERCVYVIDIDGQADICLGLRDLGIDIDSCIRKRQMIFLTKEQAYLKDDYFSPLAMLGLIKDAHYQALKTGYNGLRCAGEGNWAGRQYPGVGMIIDYEREVNSLFLRNRLNALCLYNEEVMPEKILHGVLQTHHKVIIYGAMYNNPFYIPPEEFENQIREEYKPGTYQKLRDSIISRRQ